MTLTMATVALGFMLTLMPDSTPWIVPLTTPGRLPMPSTVAGVPGYMRIAIPVSTIWIVPLTTLPGLLVT
jgi:hypothetical protein